MFPRRMGPRFGAGPGRRRGGNDSLLLILLLQLGRQIMNLPYKPPVTLVLIGIQVAFYLRRGYPGIPSIENFCLRPSMVLEDLDLKRLVISALLHGSDQHLYFNMVSFLWKGVNLERSMGSIGFGGLLLFLLLCSHFTLALVAYVLYKYSSYKSAYHTCSIGFSAVIFGLKVILNSRSPGVTNIYGFALPTAYAAWLELVLIQLIVPNASFLGHLAGIIAGLLYLKVGDRMGEALGFALNGLTGTARRRRYDDRRDFSGYRAPDTTATSTTAHGRSMSSREDPRVETSTTLDTSERTGRADIRLRDANLDSLDRRVADRSRHRGLSEAEILRQRRLQRFAGT